MSEQSMRQHEIAPEMGEFGPRTKRQYAALTGITGLRPPYVAKFFGTTQQAVSRWERDGYRFPPREAWELVEGAMRAYLRAVDAVVNGIEDKHNPDEVKVLLTWYRNPTEYYKAHASDDDGGVKHPEVMWALADARMRGAATELMLDGYAVEFVRPGDMPDGRADGVLVVPRG